MSRRRGEFEHRTSIFEGAFRAWSHLGGIEPLDLESKASTDLDPLNFPIEHDPRLAAQKNKKKKNAENNNGGGGDDFGGGISSGGDAKKDDRREYPYEPLPRSGLAHPFVQAILSPWLGPDADQDAIQLGLTTLRTWWQHRRKGESGSAIVALDTDKMRGVVEGYTRHFFNLAHCLVVNDKEQPPRTLHTKMRELEKSRNKKGGKKRGREEDTVIKAAAMAFQSGFGPNKQRFAEGSDPTRGGQSSNLSPLERLHEAQRNKLAEIGGVRSNMGGGAGTFDPAPLGNIKGRCVPGKVDLPKLVQQVSSSATQLAHRGTMGSTGMNSLTSQNVDPSKYGDPNVTPVVMVSLNGITGTKEYQICLTIIGITCAHCVKIVETVLKGCNGSRSPIEGLLDAAADMELGVVLIKIQNIADVRRIAHESARNLSMVGYTAQTKSVTVPGDVTMANVHSVFENTIPSLSPMVGFNWNLECGCPANNVWRQDCPRHSQFGPGVIEVFDKTQQLLFNFLDGCSKKTGLPCTAGDHCFCAAPAGRQPPQAQDANPPHPSNTNEYPSYQQPLQDGGGGVGGGGTGGEGAPASKRQRPSMRMSVGGFGGLSRHLSITSETTFGRSMSGLSALSIDWENMEDFDVNVDHSAGINNDIIDGQRQQQQQQVQQQPLPGQTNTNQAGGAPAHHYQQGNGQYGAGAYQQQMQQYSAGYNNMGGGGARRSSFVKNNTPGNSNGLNNVSFKEMMS